MKEFEVWGEHITLGQLLKVAGVVDSGGEVRYYLSARPVMVNGQPETRRGRKLVPGDRVTTPGLDLLLTPEGSTTGEEQDAADAVEPLYEKPAFQPPAHIGPPARRMRRVMRRGTRQTMRRNAQQAGPQAAGRGKDPARGGGSARPGAGAAEPSDGAGAGGASKPAAPSAANPGGNTPADPDHSHDLP